MSYCRFAWDGSDVYVYESEEGIECCGCRLNAYGTTTDTPEEMIMHLAEHKKAGHFVPFYAIEGLWHDIEGPNKAVRPEPENITKVKEMMAEERSKITNEQPK